MIYTINTMLPNVLQKCHCNCWRPNATGLCAFGCDALEDVPFISSVTAGSRGWRGQLVLELDLPASIVTSSAIESLRIFNERHNQASTVVDDVVSRCGHDGT